MSVLCGAKSYDDRGLWCYQLYNDGGGRSYMMKVCGATKSTLSKVSDNLIMSVGVFHDEAKITT